MGILLAFHNHIAEFLKVFNDFGPCVLGSFEFRATINDLELGDAFIVIDQGLYLILAGLIAFEVQTVLLGNVVSHGMNIKRR